MTREQIVAGLEAVILLLGNEAPAPPDAPEWEPHEWAYVKGIASGEILRLRNRLADGAAFGVAKHPRSTGR